MGIMDIHKLTMKDVEGLDSALLRDVERDIRKQICDYRMDIYANASAHASKVRQLRRGLARVHTHKSRLGSKLVQRKDAVK